MERQGFSFRLTTHKLAVEWNSGLPCSGRIVSITVKKNVAAATFVLGERPRHHCDAPGQKAQAELTVRNGKILYREYFWDHAEALEAMGLSE